MWESNCAKLDYVQIIADHSLPYAARCYPRPKSQKNSPLASLDAFSYPILRYSLKNAAFEDFEGEDLFEKVST